MRLLRAFAVLAVLLGSASAIEAQTVITLAWDANTESDLAGYQVSYGTQSGVYSTIVDVGNVTSVPFTLPSGIVHYFAVKAYNSASPRQYSPYSTEVSTAVTTNRAPTLTQPTNQTSAEYASVSLQLVASDPDGTAVTYSAAGLPASLTVNATTGLISGTLTYTSAGSNTVTATVSDGALSNSKTFAWTVTNVNRAPTLTQPANQTSAENASVSLQLVASDPDGTAVTYSATGLPASLTVNATTGLISGTLTYTSAGNYTVTATVSDGVLTNSQTFAWTVTNVNRAPTLTQPANQTSAENANISLQLVASDPDGTAVTYSATGLLASLTVNATTGLISGTLSNTSAGGYTVTATVSDGALTNSQTFTWTVTDVARATPVVTWANPVAITYGTALSGTQLNATANVAGSFVYAPASGILLTAGTQTLSVTFTPTDTANYTTATQTTTLTVAKATPVITWANPASAVAGTLLGATQLNATASVAGSSVYTPPSGTLLTAGTQTLSVTFTPTDAVNYTTTIRTVTLTVTDVVKTTPVITWANPAAITYGTALGATQLNATASVAGTFAYSPTAGTVLTAGTQTLSVTFTPTDAVNYTTASRTVTIDVARATPVITWANPAAITYGTALGATQLNATANVAGNFVYTPASGTLLTAGTGRTLSVTFTPTDAVNYTTASRTVTIDVARATPVVTWANPVAVVTGTTLGATQLNATASVAGTFVYNPAAGTVLTAGTQTLSVTFTPTDMANYTTATRTVTLTVTAAVRATPVVTWAIPGAIVYGTALSGTQLNATANVAGSFVYAPASGTLLTAGTGRILSVTFTPTDAVNYTTATRTVTLTVTRATPVITWTPPAAVVAGTVLGATQLNATASVAGTFVYNPAAGTVLTAGTQTLTVTFTPTDTANYTTATRAVSLTITAVVRATPVITWTNPASITYGTTLGATQLNATASVAGTFVYNPAAGTVLTAGTQTLSVTFTPTDAVNYTAAGRTVTIDVARATPVITWANPATITYGTALGATQLNATANVAGSFVYTPASGTVLTAGTGRTLSVTFAPTDAVNYTTASRTVTIDVARATPVVTWTPPASVVTGTTLGATQLNATASVAGTFVYNPAAGTVLTAGTQTLSVIFTPTDTANYTTATRTVTLTVTDVVKTTPVIAWANPASITYGTALSGTQLNATASVAGTFVYSPAAGTVLTAGTQTLSVTFTPTDTVNYTTASNTVTIDVVKATVIIKWSNPKRIAKGKPLGATELNATADVVGTASEATGSDGMANIAGTFIYTPPAGTVLAEGTYTLSVAFTPADSANYSAATGTTSLVVLPEPTLAVTPATLRFAGTNTSGTLNPITAPQTATVTFSSPVATTWSASADQPWVQITNGSGVGSGTFTVGMINPGNVLGGATTATATITVTASGASNSPQRITVALSLRSASALQAPFGAFDTPADGAANLSGSIAVTGWALDDVGIDRVEIWRDPVAGETTTPYYGPGQPGHGKIFVANPLFITGSRVDVEGAYPSYPFASRAGWGYLLLSWGLWNQGNATYTLYAFAFDADGHSTTLGTKTITGANASTTRPFGAIDTPGYGETKSGSFWNYGWALTPNATPPCTITNGNVQVGIDSRPLAAVNYGDLRTDIAAAFPGFSNGTNSGGAYYIDTTTLSNGIHQIGWLVTDSCGRQDGVGSRFFTVLNVGGDAAAARRALGGLPVLPVLSEAGGSTGRVEGSEAGGSTGRVEGSAAARASAANAEPVSVRQVGGDWQSVAPGADGTRVIEVVQDGRIEVQLPPLGGGAYAGAQEVAESRRALPLGSSLDAKAGIFYWQPAAGFLGKYDLEFGPGAGRGAPVRVRVVVGPAMRAVIDAPQAEAVVAQPFTVAGWALDLAANEGTGVDTVHVWAYPATGAEPIFLGVAAYGATRPDVGAIFGEAFTGAAYGLTVDMLPPGTYDVVVYPHRARTDSFEGALVVRVTVR